MATESWRITRDHLVLGTLHLHNRNGVWWQSEIEVVPGMVTRFDLQAEGASGGIDSRELFESAASFVTWAKREELRLREMAAHCLLVGEYFCRAGGLLALSKSRPSFTRAELLSNLKLSLLIFLPGGSSDWNYTVTDLCGVESVGFMLDSEHELKTPVNVL